MQGRVGVYVLYRSGGLGGTERCDGCAPKLQLKASFRSYAPNLVLCLGLSFHVCSLCNANFWLKVCRVCHEDGSGGPRSRDTRLFGEGVQVQQGLAGGGFVK